MGERGVEIDHTPPHCWLLKYMSLLQSTLLARKRPWVEAG